ncbi:aminodeoxychorismate synthase component I [Alteromonas sp. ASW11-36]|uniref:aminodeoxychorismate synthase n=1 Tax=Alteromonas arenosi TaxID=3055817 RepID=A0ABT7SXT6_9ALTE|nr:aminodeoxychorismate synthase component I [Alteromonas sp. ASW11-36]MDM7860986.1 aminodeoxychorismate synthase component I [Alteromonas sp. ASW11-36]
MQKKAFVISPIRAAQPVDVLTLFAQYAGQPWALLFDSAGEREADNQFDILLHSPSKTIEAFPNSTRVTDVVTGAVVEHSGDPIAIARDIHRSFVESISEIEQPDNTSLPFLAGIAGMFSYDLGRHFEHLPSPFKEHTSTPRMALGLYTRSLILDRKTHTLYDCHLTDQQEQDIKLSSGDCKADFALTSKWQNSCSKKNYVECIARIHDYLIAGDCYQVNFAQHFAAHYTGDEWQAYKQLRDANKAPFSAFMRLPKACILSISPERFLAVKDGQVETKPIKGTRPRSVDSANDQALAEELLASPKDRAENLMIVDLLRNDISKHCQPNSVLVPKPFALESYAAVHHLVSTVTGQLNANSDPFALLRDAFPGGSITGAPKVRAMQIIDELESQPRSIYCGSIGYVGIQNDMDTSICIRTLLAESNRLHCWAGGGIVLDSDAESEYQESLDKVNKILPVLA